MEFKHTMHIKNIVDGNIGTMTLRIKGLAIWEFKLKCAVLLVRCGCRLGGFNFEIEKDERKDNA